MKKAIILMLILAMSAVLSTGCSGMAAPAEAVPESQEASEAAITVVDGLGKTVVLKKNPQRVVCLYTSYLDLWDLAGGRVVGRPDSKENVPEVAKDAETVGSYLKPNVEKILALQPDLVILNSGVSGQVELMPIFEKNGIPHLVLEYTNFDDYLNILNIFTDLTENKELYQANGLEVKSKVDEIISRVPKDKKPSVLLLLSSSQNVSARLPDSTVGDMLQDLGAVNIAYDPNMKAADMEIFSMERVIERDPDFILVQTMGDVAQSTARVKEDIEGNPAWGYLTAVKEGRYIYLPKDLFLFKANERYAEAYEYLAKLLYPETFK
jgi:iron complex transport system substrate-binding protein